MSEPKGAVCFCSSNVISLSRSLSLSLSVFLCLSLSLIACLFNVVFHPFKNLPLLNTLPAVRSSHLGFIDSVSFIFPPAGRLNLTDASSPRHTSWWRGRRCHGRCHRAFPRPLSPEKALSPLTFNSRSKLPLCDIHQAECRP